MWSSCPCAAGPSTTTEPEAFWYLNLTTQQQCAYDRFRALLKEADALLPGYNDKNTLLRFLKARQWDPARATTMYTDMVAWRNANDLDQLYESFTFPELDDVCAVYPHFYHKTDKFGRPVYIELLGRCDPPKLLELVSVERITKYHIWTWERFERQLLPACSKIKGKPIITATVIIDMAGLSLKNFTLSAQRLVHSIAKIDQDYYPEHLASMFIINTPFIFKAIWAVVCPLLEERTRKKIMVLGCDYASTLKQLIPEENLPVMFGGKSECPDHKHSIGPWYDSDILCPKLWMPKSTSQEGKAAATDTAPVIVATQTVL